MPTLPAMLTVELLTEDRLDAALDAIVPGFAQEQNFVRIFSDEQTREGLLRVVMRPMARLSIRYGGSFIAVDRGEIIGGIIGYPPVAYPYSARRILGMLPMYARVLVTSPRAALRFFTADLSHHPRGESFWYLYATAVRPGHRSLRVLQQLFTTLIERIDADNAATFGETALPAVVFGATKYFGFSVRAEEVRLIKGGPANWTIWRPAQSSARLPTVE